MTSLILYFVQVPKLVHQEVLQGCETLCSATGYGLNRELFEKHFNIFAPENVYRSVFALESKSQGLLSKSGTFAFTRLMDLSPAEVSFLTTCSFLERLLFSILRQDRKFLDGIVDFVMEAVTDEPCCNHLERGTLRAVTRMLLLPSKSEAGILKRKVATGPGDDPFEALVVSHQERLLSDVKLLHSTYSFIPRARAPPVCTFSLKSIFR